MVNIKELGTPEPEGTPLKIVRATIGRPKPESQFDALQLTFEKVRGGDVGGQFTKNYTIFNHEGQLSGDGIRYLRQAGRALGLTGMVEETEDLVGKTFYHETRERPNQSGGNPWIDFFPKLLWSENGGTPHAPAEAVLPTSRRPLA